MKRLIITLTVVMSAFACMEVMAQHQPGYVRPHDEIVKPTTDVAVENGIYEADWDNLSAWECPDWFRDAKFGIWAHWDPQCEAEDGDWYARSMYGTGGQRTTYYNYFGHYPDHDWGYKEFCRYWKAEAWDPAALIKLYYEAGARYFMTMGQHHDNYDCWDSPYQEWNCMNMGPGKDIIGGWMEACRQYPDLRVGVSMHGAHAWTFFEVGRNADTGVTKEEGAGKWWEGYDPQELYAQNHPHSSNWSDWGSIHSQWHWGNGVCQPTVEYMQKFQNRVLQFINDYNPDMIYFDDTVLPFYGATTNTNDQFSLNILKHFYNHSAAQHGGKQDVVVTGKILKDQHKRAMMWDVERGIPDQCQEEPWQTCTCIGGWHYSKSDGDRNNYKQADQVIRMLVDVVSKNGNLLLSIPVRGNGTIDNNEKRIVADITAWMKINSSSIYATRPWKTCGEGPLIESSNPLNDQGFNEGISYSDQDVRYVTKDGKVFATIMRWPSAGDFTFQSFSIASPYYSGKVTGVKLLGYGDVAFENADEGLTVTVPSTHPNEIAPVFEITLEEETMDYAGLQDLIQIIEDKIATFIPNASYNTGKYSMYSIEQLSKKVDAAKAVSEDADAQSLEQAISALRSAYGDFLKNKKNKGGVLGTTGTDMTTSALTEASGFSRSDGRTTRFGTPRYWTVENFSVPQTNSNGTKNGIDNYPGYNCLMLGLWSGEDGSTSSDLSNARIYQKVKLAAGKYFFAGVYNAAYQMNPEAYIFASTELVNTKDIPTKSLAYYELNKCGTDGQIYGIEFTLDEETEVYLGWQINLTKGAANQEMRIQSVKLIQRKSASLTNLKTLLNNCNTALKKTVDNINDNTGYYNREMVEQLQYYVDLYTEVSEDPDATDAEINNAYYILRQAYDDFQANGMNPGGLADKEDATDLTIEKLTESANFSRIDASTTRFSTPKYWTVENFTIPQTNSDGTKNGIDSYSGQNSLMIGVWDDRGRASGSLVNSRIYQQIHLEKGRYYFGASFNAIYNLYKAYMFVSSELVSTTIIPTKSIAYYDISKCSTNGQFYGLYFTLYEDQDVYIGFEANMASGGAQQEFRADGVVLYRYDNAVVDGIEDVRGCETEIDYNAPVEYYNLSGIRLNRAPEKGIFIVKQGRKVSLRSY